MVEQKVTVKLVLDDFLGEFYFAKDPLALARQLRSEGRYRKAAEFVTLQSDEAAAEEAFDISNNPSCETLRREVFGHFRSVSVGDIVEVNGQEFLCASMGWKKLS